MKSNLNRLKPRRLPLGARLLALALAVSVPLLLTADTQAAQLTSRKLAISSAVPSATGVTYTYTFSTATTGTVQSVKFEACTTAVGTCSAPAGVNINQGAEATRSGWSGATTFARDVSGGGGCTPGSGVLCIKRTDVTSETAGSRSLGWDTQTNPSSTNATFFVRITTYSDAAWGTSVDTGTVAAATVQTLTINANVAEVLNFCIGSTDANDATTDVTGASSNDCAGVSGTSVHIGTLDTSAVNVSPVNSNGGNNKNGVALVRTNAASGIVISYDAVQQSGSNHLGTLRISGATCNSGVNTNSTDGLNPDTNNTTDQCINAQGTGQAAFSNGTEKFGMTIAAINCNFVSAYTCTYSTGTYNLTRDAQYDGNGGNTYTTDSGQVSGTTNAGYTWDETGNPDQVASSATVVADEALILKFAATPSLTTPFGVYSAQADFVATPTY